MGLVVAQSKIKTIKQKANAIYDGKCFFIYFHFIPIIKHAKQKVNSLFFPKKKSKFFCPLVLTKRLQTQQFDEYFKC